VIAMRTGCERPLLVSPPPLEELEELARSVGAALVEALKVLPSPDQTPACDRELVQDIRWTISEASRLTTLYRTRLDARLDRPSRPTPSTTWQAQPPGQSHPTSTHDPPDACQPRSSPP
jgi:hypothetical protein